MDRKFNEQELVRQKKLNELIAKDIMPFGSKFIITSTTGELVHQFGNLNHEKIYELVIKNKQAFSIAGRIMTKRGKGKAGFCHLQDHQGQIQLYLRADQLTQKEFYDIWEKADLGDIVGVEGIPMKTKVGELSLKVTKLIHLAKALRPLPEKFHGLTNVEERFRRRYVDLIVNQNARFVAITRFQIIRTIQNYLDGQGFIEVETPILQSVLGGAAAKPFTTHHNKLGKDFYLRIATELPLKKLIVGGMHKVYEIGRLFRNEGVSKKHNPEFTAIELYQAYADYHDMMDLTEGIFKIINEKIFNSQNLYTLDGETINLATPFQKITMVKAIKNELGIDFTIITKFSDVQKLAKEHGINIEKHWTTAGYIINAFFEKFVEAKLIKPTFICDYPIEISPLAKAKFGNPLFTDRFELFIIGREYANAFSELNDPIEQLQRFKNQIKERKLGNDEATEIDMDYIEALEYGMPPCGGLGIGIDRMIMLFTSKETIREVILFPHNRERNE